MENFLHFRPVLLSRTVPVLWQVPVVGPLAGDPPHIRAWPVYQTSAFILFVPYTYLYHNPLSSRIMAPGCSISALATIRLSNPSICKMHGCGETLLSGAAFYQHVKRTHQISTAKSGSEKMLCPWEGCGEYHTKGSLFNHILGHNVKNGCGLCDDIIAPRSDTVQKHFRKHHEETHGSVSITSKTCSQYAYMFFS